MRWTRRADGTRILQPKPIDELERLGDYFRCAPYSATINAIACLRRQRSAKMIASRSRKERLQGVGLGYDSRCFRCALGALVAKRFESVDVAKLEPKKKPKRKRSSAKAAKKKAAKKTWASKSSTRSKKESERSTSRSRESAASR